MTELLNYFFISVLAVYGLAFILKKSALGWSLFFLLTAFIAHLGLMIIAFSENNQLVIASPFGLYQGSSWAIIGIYLVLSHYFRFLDAGWLLIPLAMIFYLLSLFNTTPHPWIPSAIDHPWAISHITLMTIGLTFFMVSFVLTLIYFWINRSLKMKVHLTEKRRIPSLDVVEKLHFRFLYLGFVFFTLSLIAGGGWNKAETGYYLMTDPKEFLSLGVWVYFAIFINLKWVRGWVGQKGLWITLPGFIALLMIFYWT